MVKNRTGPDLKVVGCSVQAGLDVFTKVGQLTDLAGSERRRKGVPICSGGVDPRGDGCVGAMHWSSRRDLAAGHPASAEVLLESRVLFPEPTSMLAASRRTGGYGAGKTTPPP